MVEMRRREREKKRKNKIMARICSRRKVVATLPPYFPSLLLSRSQPGFSLAE
jgi:hypothetical protein